MPTMLTKSQFKSAQKQLVLAEKDKAKARRQALSTIAAARSSGHPGKLILAREDACGEYILTRHFLNQRRAQLRDVHVMQ